MLSAFDAEKVEFLLVDAYALAVYGLPRATGDIDLWVRRSPENAERILTALRAFGAPTDEVSVEDFEKPDLEYQIGVVPRRVDISTSISGLRFEDAWPDRLTVEIEDLAVPVISHRHLKQNKRSVGRPKDNLDADWLESHGDDSNRE